MAETKLEIRADGLDEIIAGFQAAVKEGDKLVDTAAAIGEAQSKSAQQAVAAQEQYNAGLRTTGKELKALSDIDTLGKLATDADRELRTVARSIVDMGKKLRDMGPEGKQAFGEIIKMMVNLENVLREGEKLQKIYVDGLAQVGTESSALVREGLATTEQALQKNSEQIKGIVEEITSTVFAEGLPEGGLPIVNSIIRLKEELADLEGKAQALDVIADEFQKQRASVEGNAEALERLNQGEQELAKLRAENKTAIDQNIASQEELTNSLGTLFDAQAQAEDASVEASERAAAADAERVERVTAVAVAQKMQADASLSVAEATRLVADEAAKAAQVQQDAAAGATEADRVRAGLIADQVQGIKELEEAQRGAKTEEDLGKINRELTEAKGNLRELQKVGFPDPEPAAERTVTLRTRIQQATSEVARLVDEGKGITPELVVAAQKAAELRSEFQDVNAVITALDPSQKFQAFAGLTQSIIGGFTAMSGVLGALGVGEKNAEQITAKMQSLLAVLQGANAFLEGFGKGLKALNAFTIANTTATTANTTAKGANAGASVALAGANTTATAATGGLTGAVRTLTAAMAANPLITAVVVLAGIAAAMVAMGDDAQDAAEKADLLIEKLDQIEAFNTKSTAFAQRKRDLELEIALIERGGNAFEQRNLIEEKSANLQRKLTADRENAVREQVELEKEIIQIKLKGQKEDAANAGNALDVVFNDRDERKKAVEDLEKRKKASADRILEIDREAQLAGLQLQKDVIAFETAEGEKAEKEAERLSKEAIQRAKAESSALLKVQQDYANSVRALAARLDSDIRNEQITILEQQISDAEAQGRVEQARELKDQIVQIRQDQSNELIAEAQRDLERKLAMIELERTMSVEALKNLSEDQRNALADKLIDSGEVQLAASEVEKFQALVVLASEQAERARTKNKADEVAARIRLDKEETDQAIKTLDAFEAFAVASAENEVGTEREKQAKIIGIQIETAKKKIAILEATGDILDATEAEKLRTVIAGLEADLASLSKFSLKNLFNLSDADVQIINDVFNQVGAAIEAGFLRQIDLQRQANEEYIEGLNERLALTQQAIDREQRSKEEGLAHNLQRELEAQETLLQQREAAQKESERLAKREREVQKVVQVANLASTVAKLLSSEASKGVIGLGIAAAAIPLLFSLFGKVKTQAANAAFYEGTPYLELGHNRPGRDTIPVMAHHGERIIPTKQNLSYWDLLEGIRTGNAEQLERGIMDAAERHGLDAVRDAFTSREPLPSIDMGFPSRMQAQRESTERMKAELSFDPMVRHLLSAMDGTMREMLAEAIGRVDRVGTSDDYTEFHPGGKRRVKRKA